MARLYPRFLFSNPKNTKSPGPFVVHLLEPRLVFKVVNPKKEKELLDHCGAWAEDYVGLIPLDKQCEGEDESLHDKILHDAFTWLTKQMELRNIVLSQ